LREEKEEGEEEEDAEKENDEWEELWARHAERL